MPRRSPLEKALARLGEQQALADEAERIAAIGTYVYDPATGEAIRSTEMKRLWGIPQEGPVEMESVVARVHPDERGVMLREYERLVTDGGRIDREYRLIMDDGEIRHVHVLGEVIEFERRKGPRIVGTVQDITDRKRAEELIAEQTARLKEMQAELIFLARQSAMGTMAATLAHELNQPLTAISNYARGLGRHVKVAGSGELAEILGALQENALRAGEIIRRMREMAREGSFRKEPVDIGEMIRETGRFSGLGRHCVEFGFDIGHTQTVQADRVQVQQVLVNLLRNACEAVEEAGGGEIVIASRDEGSDVTVCVTDSGPGIDPAVFPSLFEAKVSTKPEGMGIGLSISRTIIEAHGGRIWAENPAKGARFCFTLPGG